MSFDRFGSFCAFRSLSNTAVALSYKLRSGDHAPVLERPSIKNTVRKGVEEGRVAIGREAGSENERKLSTIRKLRQSIMLRSLRCAEAAFSRPQRANAL